MKQKPLTQKQIINKISKDIEGMTHDIKTLEGFAQSLLALRLELKEIQYNMSSFKTKFKGCNYQGCSQQECSVGKIINLIKEEL